MCAEVDGAIGGCVLCARRADRAAVLDHGDMARKVHDRARHRIVAADLGVDRAAVADHRDIAAGLDQDRGRDAVRPLAAGGRSEERRVGKEWVSPFRSRWIAYY